MAIESLKDMKEDPDFVDEAIDIDDSIVTRLEKLEETSKNEIESKLTLAF